MRPQAKVFGSSAGKGPTPARSLRTSVLLPSFLLSLSCAGHDGRIRVSPPAERFVAVAVTEFKVPAGSEDFAVFKRTSDILDVLWHDSNWLVITPDEFRVRQPQGLDAPGALTATDLVVRAQSMALDPRRFGILSFSLAIRQAMGQARSEKGEDVAVGFHSSSDVEISAIMRNMTGARIAELSIVRAVDPLAERPVYDTQPQVRAAVRELTRLLVARCATCVTAVKRPSFKLEASPAWLLDATDTRGSSLRERLAVVDEIEREQLLWRHLQYLAPGIELAVAKQHWVHKSAACLGPEPPAPFFPGDCLVSIDDKRPLNRHQVARLLARGPAQIEVVGRDGLRRQVAWP